VLAALFPGQNSQAIGMAKDLYDGSAAARRVLDEAEAALPGLLTIMWEGPAETLQLTAHQQPALVAAGAAAFAAYLEAGGQRPAYGAGHSLGEFTAHVAAGSLSVAQAVQLVHKRGTYMQEAVPQGQGAMAAILKVDASRVRQACDDTPGVVEVANFNSPEQIVISGEVDAVAAAGERLKAEGARVIPLKVSAPFHCSLMQPAADRLARDLAGLTFGSPAFPIVTNVTAEPLDDPQDAPRLLEQQVTHPVRWTEIMQKLAASGVTRYLEFGSGKVLTGLAGRTLGTVDALAVTDMQSLKEAL
jgi:[acyl-carrier-protein] S-malonyltransferase